MFVLKQRDIDTFEVYHQYSVISIQGSPQGTRESGSLLRSHLETTCGSALWLPKKSSWTVNLWKLINICHQMMYGINKIMLWRLLSLCVKCTLKIFGISCSPWFQFEIVTQMRFGDLDNPREEGFYTLGKLKCYSEARDHTVTWPTVW